jgi:hypothetical protein
VAKYDSSVDTSRHRVTTFAVFVLLVGACSAPGSKPSESARVALSSPPAQPSSPSAAANVALRPCTQQDIAASFDGWGAAAGSVGGTFRLTLSSGSPCALPARPAVGFVDESGGQLLVVENPETSVTWVPVFAGAGTEATVLVLVWSNHGAEPAYRCARTAAPAALRIELPSWQIPLAFPPQSRPTFCVDPPEQVFVSVVAR